MRPFPAFPAIVLSAFAFAPAQIQREPVPDLDSYLQVSHDIDPVEAVKAAPMQGTMQGVEENLPAVRTAESVSQEVQQHQTRLTHLFKSWKIKQAKGVEGRHYGLILTIGASGEVETVVVQGHANADFVAEVAASVKTWSFSKVKDPKPFTAKLRNLDFLYRKELVLE